MTESTRAQGGERRALYSVAQIQHILRVEFQRARRYGYPLACIVLSVDQLGSVRDRLGYEAKEQVLEAIVELLQRNTRGSDFLGRTADDRLIVVVPHTPADGVRVLCERLLSEARKLALAGAGRSTLSLGWADSSAVQVAYHDELLALAEAAHADASAQGGDQSRAARS
ncbi:MAG: diguanylate cyclase [Planctomycetes bacterium]|nr:diguanylate cyclase [Planctomycetota bacterium]